MRSLVEPGCIVSGSKRGKNTKYERYIKGERKAIINRRGGHLLVALGSFSLQLTLSRLSYDESASNGVQTCSSKLINLRTLHRHNNPPADML